MAKNVIKISSASNDLAVSSGSSSRFSINAGTPGPPGPQGPVGPQGDAGILVLGLADPVPPETPEDTLIVRYDNT